MTTNEQGNETDVSKGNEEHTSNKYEGKSQEDLLQILSDRDHRIGTLNAENKDRRLALEEIDSKMKTVEKEKNKVKEQEMIEDGKTKELLKTKTLELEGLTESNDILSGIVNDLWEKEIEGVSSELLDAVAELPLSNKFKVLTQLKALSQKEEDKSPKFDKKSPTHTANLSKVEKIKKELAKRPGNKNLLKQLVDLRLKE